MSTTEINESLFSVTLPGSWQRDDASSPEEGLWVYGCDDSEERLTVNAVLVEKKLGAAEIHELFEQFCKARRGADREMSASIELGEVLVTRLDGATTGFYAGEDESGRRSGSFIIVNGAGMASFSLEAFGLNAEEFADRSASVFEQVGFVEIDTNAS